MFEQAFKNIDDVLRKEAGCTTELDYTEQTSWLLFLRYLADLEQDKAMEAQVEGKKYSYILEGPCRWENWGAPKGKDGQIDHKFGKQAYCVIEVGPGEDSAEAPNKLRELADQIERLKA